MHPISKIDQDFQNPVVWLQQNQVRMHLSASYFYFKYSVQFCIGLVIRRCFISNRFRLVWKNSPNPFPNSVSFWSCFLYFVCSSLLFLFWGNKQKERQRMQSDQMEAVLHHLLMCQGGNLKPITRYWAQWYIQILLTLFPSYCSSNDELVLSCWLNI